jgi:hypothetical protein
VVVLFVVLLDKMFGTVKQDRLLPLILFKNKVIFNEIKSQELVENGGNVR